MELTQDAFLGGRLQLLQPCDGYRAGVDAVLLAAACCARAGESVLDLGCGVGTAALCLGARVPCLRLAGIELQTAYAALAVRNATASGQIMDVYRGDLTDMPAGLRARSFDHVISNPPYYRRGQGSRARNAGRDCALGESATLEAWVDAACRRLRPGGMLTMIQKADRLAHLLRALDTRLGSVRVLPLAARAGRDAGLVLIRARKGGRGAFQLSAPLIMHAGNAHPGDCEHYAPTIRAVLRDGAPLPFGD